MANGGPLSTIGRALQGFAAGVQNPGFAAQQAAEERRLGQQQQQFEERQAAAQREMRMALIQNALQNLPAGHSARPKLEQALGQMSGIEGIGAGFVQPAAEPDVRTLTPGARLGVVEQGPEGPAFRQIAEGREPTGRAPVQVTIEGDQPVFGEKAVVKQLEPLVEAGRNARAAEQDYQQLANLIIDPSVQTGNLQPALTSLQGVAADLGVNLEGAAKRLGINLGNLERKEDFNRLSRRVLINSFEDFKGNLNAEEVRIARESVNQLGTSEEANIEAIASGLAAATISRQRGVEAIQAGSAAEGRSVLARSLGDDPGEFIQIRNQIAADLKQRRQQAETQVGLPPGIPQGSRRLTGPTGQVGYETPDGRILIVE